jgi:SAM-dependent methyltransferase
MLDLAACTAAGARVLDLGAGDAPYRELFAHTDYRTSDWSESVHMGAGTADIVASADDLPVADESFELVVCTQVLEHVPEPASVLAECHRVLVPGGRLALTAPLLWELHELPHDYYRYTSAGLHHLMRSAGFAEADIKPRGDGFTALAQLMGNLRWAMGDAPDGLTDQRNEARAILARLSDELAALAHLDAQRVMPLGYSATALKP